MIRDGSEFVVDGVSKFFNFLHINGWFHDAADQLIDIEIIGLEISAAKIKICVPHKGVEAAFGENKGFEISIFRASEEAIPEDAYVIFKTRKRKNIEAGILELARDRVERYYSPKLYKSFKERIDSLNGAKLLDIGGRDRSRNDRSREFVTADVTVFDIIPGENVDVVGDAHEISNYFGSGEFDAAMSISVFEHLLMPWKAVIGLNKVLKVGGVALISTHQTLGLHDAPWDFWRFSDTSWDALFNAKTGFKIVERVQDFEQYIIPFIYRPRSANAEKSAGFEASMVLVEKIGDCELEWPVTVAEVVSSAYPENDDRQDGSTELV